MKARTQKRLISLALLLSQFQVFYLWFQRLNEMENHPAAAPIRVNTSPHSNGQSTPFPRQHDWNMCWDGGGGGGVTQNSTPPPPLWFAVNLAVKPIHTVSCLIFALIILFVSKHAAMSELVFPDWLHSCPLLFPINIQHHSHLPQHTRSDDIFWKSHIRSSKATVPSGCRQRTGPIWGSTLLSFVLWHLATHVTDVYRIPGLLESKPCFLAHVYSLMCFLDCLPPYFM